MNEVCWGEWGFEEVSSGIEPGEKGPVAVAQVRVWLKDIEFQPVGWGQSRVTRGDIGDAKKGAQTDAIKKALSYFSIGNRAYQGLLEAPDKSKRPPVPATPRPPERPAPRQQAPAPVPARSNPAPQAKPEMRQSAPVVGNRAQDDLKDVPTGAQIRARFEREKPKHPQSKMEFNWPSFLAYALADVITAGKGITVTALVKAGDELGPNYCKVLAAALDKLTDSSIAA